MTEPHDRSLRLELGPLAPGDAEADRVIASIMARLGARPQVQPAPTDVREIIAAYLAPTRIAAAAALAIVGSAAIIATVDGQTTAPPPSRSGDALIATWADGQHVPTNGELLIAFQGYEP